MRRFHAVRIAEAAAIDQIGRRFTAQRGHHRRGDALPGARTGFVPEEAHFSKAPSAAAVIGQRRDAYLQRGNATQIDRRALTVRLVIGRVAAIFLRFLRQRPAEPEVSDRQPRFAVGAVFDANIPQSAVHAPIRAVIPNKEETQRLRRRKRKSDRRRGRQKQGVVRAAVMQMVGRAQAAHTAVVDELFRAGGRERAAGKEFPYDGGAAARVGGAIHKLDHPFVVYRDFAFPLPCGKHAGLVLAKMQEQMWRIAINVLYILYNFHKKLDL